MKFSTLKFGRIFCLFLTIALLFPFVAAAHDGIHDQIVAISKKIKSDPANPELYLKRAELRRVHAECKTAEHDYLQARKLNPNLDTVDLGLGKLWLGCGQLPKAKRALASYLSNQPNSFEGVITMARLAAKLKETDTALRYFTQAITLAPKDSVEIYLGRAEILASNSQTDEALRSLDEGIEKLGPLVTLQTAAIDFEVKRGRYDSALERLDKLVAKMPRKESLLLRRGEILLQASKPCDARESFIAAENGFNSLPASRRKVRAVKAQMTRVQMLLNSQTVKSCPTV